MTRMFHGTPYSICSPMLALHRKSRGTLRVCGAGTGEQGASAYDEGQLTRSIGKGATQSTLPVGTAFGGKSKIADYVWKRIGNPRNAIEPFAFSAAWMLRRPEPGAIETINDLNAYVSNFWRAIRADPEVVAAHADWPVNECDLHARHRWLVQSHESQHRLQAVRDDPEAYDAKIAGWFCWGACAWIGSGWCDTQQLPHIADAGQGIAQQLPDMDGDRGVLGSAGDSNHAKRPQLADAFSRGRGVNGNDAAGTCELRRQWLIGWFNRLADRLRHVRVCCGHWARVCDSPSTLTRLGTTGVFLDPPYRHTIDGQENRTK